MIFSLLFLRAAKVFALIPSARYRFLPVHWLFTSRQTQDFLFNLKSTFYHSTIFSVFKSKYIYDFTVGIIEFVILLMSQYR